MVQIVCDKIWNCFFQVMMMMMTMMMLLIIFVRFFVLFICLSFSFLSSSHSFSPSLFCSFSGKRMTVYFCI